MNFIAHWYIDYLASALRRFLIRVETQPLPKDVLATHLRYPSAGYAIVGSDLGRDLWNTKEGNELLDALLVHPQLKQWFSSNSGELRQRVASLIQAWSAVEFQADDIADHWTPQLLDDALIGAPAVERHAILYGPEVDSFYDLGRGISVRPIDLKSFQDVLRHAGGSEADLLRLPARPTLLSTVYLAGDRNLFGAFAATHTMVWGAIEVEWLRYQLWMATGEMPNLGDQFVIERATFPVNAFERQVQAITETHTHSAVTAVAVVVPTLREVVERHRAMMDDQSPSLEPLRVANRYVEVSLRSADPILVLTMGYAAIDGYLRRRDEHPSAVPRRYARLMASTVEEQRRLRALMQTWYELRGFVAHGQTPRESDVERFLRGLDQTWRQGLGGDDDALVRHARLLLRRFLLTILWFTYPSLADASAVRSRDQIVAGLESTSRSEELNVIFAGDLPAFITDISS